MGSVNFKLERDNRPLIEHFNKDSMKESFFHQQYDLAIKLIARHIDEENHAKEEKVFESYTDGNNNLFAFVGDRGTGKTSCMLSVANSLVYKGDEDFNQQVLNNTEFFTIGLLDPSYFDSEHDILMLFVAKLYSLFTEKAKKVNSDEDDYNKRTKLLKAFAATQKHIYSLLQKAENVEGDEFERLTSYAAAISLKRDICNLIDCYRDFINKQNAVLLLLVDDIDLNTSEASRMAELLRKYFVQSRMIVLISVKLDQLSYIKKLDLTREFDKILGSGIENQEIDEMAERYLSKFIPQEHRIFLPTPELYFDEELTIEFGELKRKFCTVKQAIPELIYRKTRYLFYNFDGEANYIVPRNLRDLRQLLKVLVGMEGDFTNFEEMPQNIKEKNRKIFQNYLYEDWVVNNLDNETVRLVKHITEAEDASQLNNAILQVLKEKYTKDLDNTGLDEINYITNPDNKGFNISIGDILSLLNLLSTKKVSVTDKKLIFILYTILSMKLYTYEQELNANDKQRDDMEVRPQRYKDDSKNYFKLIGGRLINTKMMELLPRKDKECLSRSNRTISRGVVEELIEELLNGKLHDYRVLELFILCAFRSTSSREDTYRTENRIAHIDFQGGRDFVFEIGSLFNNILNLDKCYERFSALGGNYEKIITRIKNNDNGCTLYEKLGGIRKHMAFRSMDLLQYFINHIGGKFYSRVDDPFCVITDFLEEIAAFKFETYKPKGVQGENVGMTMETFDEFKNVFNFKDDNNLRVQFNRLFGNEMDSKRTESGIGEIDTI